MILLLLADKHFSMTQAALGILFLLILSVPLGFGIALILRKWHDRHPIEEAPNEKKPLGLE